MTTDAIQLRKSLQKFGLSNSAIEAAWPDWWTAEADSSSSAQAELRFSLSRKLGLDPRALLFDDQPKFIWRDEAKFKRFSGKSDFDAAALASFGMAIGRALLGATASGANWNNEVLTAPLIRGAILAGSEFVDLRSLLSFSWAFGIPVVQLRIFPLQAKRMCAMAVRSGDRHAILLGTNSRYPAQMAFYLAHELGHIVLGHVAHGDAILDVDDVLRNSDDDPEELAADEFALELLTGHANPEVLPTAKNFVSAQLAQVATEAAHGLRIDPGTLILCLGHSTRRWPQVFAALARLGTVPSLWRSINEVARSQLESSLLVGDYGAFIEATLGLTHDQDGH